MKLTQTNTIQTNNIIGSGPVRIDGLAKVTGKAIFGADHLVERAAHACLVTAPIACGRIRSIDQAAARSMPGVLEILTYKNVGKEIKPGKGLLEGGFMGQSIAPLASNEIHFAGQILAVTVAETLEVAQAAAGALVIDYKAVPASPTLGSPGTREVKAKALGETKLSAGDLKQGLAEAAAVIDAWYETPAQHHNPMELFQATCAWQGDELTVWESTQSVRGTQYGLAEQLGIKPSQIHVISPFIGGAFGSRGEMGQHTALVALAAKRLGRPVKLVATREQGFTLRTFRAETRHHLVLGADAAGHLTALSHDSWELTSRSERFALAGSDATARLYACPNVRTKTVNVEADRQAPGFMRAPPEVPYMFAMESAMDELAYALDIDPLELRRRNETSVETVTNKPYTSRSLVRCMDKGAQVFGWARRDPRPGSMQEGADLVGWGYATAFYPAQIGPAACRVTISPDLRAIVEIGTHEIGTGVRTVLAQTVSDLLGVELESVEVVIGDSRLPAAPMSAGSNSTASVCTVVALACESLRRRIVGAAVSARNSPLQGADPAAVRLVAGWLVLGGTRGGSRNGSKGGSRDGGVSPEGPAEPLEVAVRRAGRGRPLMRAASNNPHGAPPLIGPALVSRGKPILLGGANLKDRMQFAFGAQFVEVRINRFTGQIRVPRMVGVFTAGRIMNSRTAHSQLVGGQIWGLSAALHEATEIDLAQARYINQDLSEYHVPVAADVGEIETILLDEVDTIINPLGIKGVGELGVTGVNAAIANAVFHATGVRLRRLPIRAGDTFAGGEPRARLAAESPGR